MRDGVLTGYVNRQVCKNCGYQGMPLIFESEEEYKKFLESIPKRKKSVSETEKEKTGIIEKTVKHERPLGVTILSFIMIFDAIFAIFLYYNLGVFNIFSWLWFYYITVFLISAVILPYGLLRGRGWSWTIGGILFALSIPVGLIFLYYLTRPHVKAFFRKT
jgi:hypothetical protein